MKKEEKIEELESRVTESEVVERPNLGRASNSYQSRIKNDIKRDEVDLEEFFVILWHGKYKIILIALLFAISAIFYALSLPNIYSSTLKLVPTAQESDSGLSSLASKYGGLASMAGISLGGGGSRNSIEHAVELMNSWHYIDAFIEKYNLKPTLMAVKGWDKFTNKLIYNDELYDITTKSWLTKKPLLSSNELKLEPSSFDTFKKFKDEFCQIEFDAELGIFSITVNHYSPSIAFELTKLLKEDINEYFRKKDKAQASKSIQFIENKINKTSNSEMLEVFYGMIESHTQKVMLTEINDEYLLTTLIPAKISDPKDKTKPKRSMIVIISTILGGVIGMLLVLFNSFRLRKEKT